MQTEEATAGFLQLAPTDGDSVSILWQKITFADCAETVLEMKKHQESSRSTESSLIDYSFPLIRPVLTNMVRSRFSLSDPKRFISLNTR